MRLVRARVRGWKLHAKELPGVPDFWFARKKVAVFVDGCFWHGCNNCLRMPKQNRAYWEAKIAGNIARGRAVNRALVQEGVGVVRIWEHEVRTEITLNKVIAKIERALERNPD
jgi:DNA mismatch endonuclease (patch repair protein)